MATPNTFSDKTGQIALTLLDENFEYIDTQLSNVNSDQVKIGISAGESNQDAVAIAIGAEAAQENQGQNGVAIGIQAGQYNQTKDSIAIGTLAGNSSQADDAIAIGTLAGVTNQGSKAIAIGERAGYSNQYANSIVLNATGGTLNPAFESSLTIKPVRNDSTGGNVLKYNSATGEITYSDMSLESNAAFNYGNTALVASNGGTEIVTSTNVDHIWHDDTASALGTGGTWHFCSDTTYRNVGNSTLRSGAIDTNYISSPSLQVVHKVYTGKTTYSVPTAGQTGTYIEVLDTIITPTKTSSKVRVEFNMSFEVHHDTILRLFRVINGVTSEVVRNNNGNYWSGFAYPGYDVDNGSTARTNHYIYIDSPNTTSAITYRLMIQSGGVGATTFYLNRPVGSAGAANYENAISQCILTEIPQ